MDLSDTTSLSGWKIVGVFNENKIRGSINPALGFVSILALISLTAASLAIILISRSFNHRILIISRHMEKVKNQDFDLIDATGGADEIGQLMSDFNSMTLRIKKLIQDVYEADIQKKNLELERKQAELNALQSQINPHFLFNTLESIRIRSLMKNETETADIVKSLSKTFRRMLVWGNDLITVRSEMEYIRDYLQIQKYRFAEKLNYEIYVPVEVMDYKISKMAIQPFIENSCVHGIEGKVGNGRITLTVKKADDKLEVLIEDDGCGIPPERLDEIRKSLMQPGDLKGSNIGIRNVCNRLKLFYGNEFEFSIESVQDEGTQVYIKIPAIL
jgi:two-component system sensor histidine kinase YesM